MKFIACGSILEKIDPGRYLQGIDHITVSGETGREARLCGCERVPGIREQRRRERSQNNAFWSESCVDFL